MIDPKQSPLFPPGHSADFLGSPRHLPPKLPSDTAPESKDAGKQAFASKRQFSLLGS